MIIACFGRISPEKKKIEAFTLGNLRVKMQKRLAYSQNR